MKWRFLLKGSLETDIQLRDGDVIFIPFIVDVLLLRIDFLGLSSRENFS